MVRSRIAAEGPALLLLAAAVAVVFPGVVSGTQFLWGDFATWYFPAHDYAAERWHAGQPPLWNPYTDGGMPFAGEADHGAFYPPSWVLHVLAHDRPSLYWGLEIFSLAHIWLAGVLTYILLRSEGCGRPASLFGGLAYGLGSVFVVRGAHVSLVCAQAWAPLVLGGALRAATGPRRLAGVVAGAIGLGLVALADSPSTLAVTAVGVAIVAVAGALAQPLRARPLILACAALGTLTALGLAIGAVQLLPTLAFLQESERSGYTWDDLTAYVVSPASLVMLLLPRIHGAFDYDALSYWGPANFVEVSAYTGLLPLALAPFALGAGGRRRALPWLALALLGLLLALGPHGGLQRFLYDHVPVLGQLRTPSRYLQLWAFGLALLAGLGFDSVLKASSRWTRGGLLAALAATLGLAGLLALLGPALLHWLEPWKQAHLSSALLSSGASCMATALALAVLRWGAAFRLKPLLVLVALFVDLALQGHGLGVMSDEQQVRRLWEEGAVRRYMAQDEGLFRVQDRYSPHARMMLSRFQSDTGPGRHLQSYVLFQQGLYSLHSRLIDLLGIRYVVRTRHAGFAGLGPSLIVPENMWIHGGESHVLLVDPPTLCDGLVVVSAEGTGQPRPEDLVATLQLEGVNGERRSVPIRMARETGFGGQAVAPVVPVAHQVHVADTQPYVAARVPVERLPLRRIRIDHAGKGSEWLLKELYLVSPDATAGGFQRVHLEPQGALQEVLYRNQDALPRAFLTADYVFAADQRAALELVAAEEFDPRRAVIERASVVAPAPPQPGLDPGRAQVRRYEPEEVFITTHVAGRGAWLVLTDPHYRGWFAEVDGERVPIARAYGLFRAVWLSPGHHHVLFSYEPRSFATGARVSLLAGFAALLLAGLAAVVSRKPRPESGAG